jgi:hypothetical protein
LSRRAADHGSGDSATECAVCSAMYHESATSIREMSRKYAPPITLNER